VRRLLVLIIAVLSIMVIGTGSAMAANGKAHFIKNLTTGTLSGANLVVNFKEAGLASGATETITVTATITENWFCVNNGGGQPSAKNKNTSTSQGSASGQFTADINGNVTGSLTITAPTTPSDGFTCPSGQNLELGSVSYTSITITDETSGATLSLSSVSSGCLLTDVRFGKFSCTG
jgi:hypothetical protein